MGFLSSTTPSQNAKVLASILGLVAAGITWRLFSDRPPAAATAAVAPRQPKETILRTQLQGRELTFVGRDCKLYIRGATNGTTAEIQVLRPGLGLARCEGIAMRAEKGYVFVEIGTLSFGAGGAAWDEYRTKDGLHWHRRFDEKWIPVEDAQF